MGESELRTMLGEAVVHGPGAAAAEGVLAEAAVGYLAMGGGAWPYCVPISYVFTGGAVYFHGRGVLKRAVLAADPRVCLAVGTAPEFLRGDGPCDDNFAYESVLVFGTVRPVRDAAERQNALREIIGKYDPAGRDASIDDALPKTVVWALDIAALTYKRHPENKG